MTKSSSREGLEMKSQGLFSFSHMINTEETEHQRLFFFFFLNFV